MWTMGWGLHGHTFIPMDFALLSSSKSGINGISDNIDKRTIGYKRRQEALLSAPQVMAAMLDRAFKDRFLLDGYKIYSCSAYPRNLVSRGLHIIGMVKNDNKRYLVNGKRLDLKALYAAAPKVEENIARFCVVSERTWFR